MKYLRTILLGMLIIAVLTPLAHICTIGMTNHDLETSAASGWVFGLLFSLVLAAAVFRWISKRSGGVHRPHMVMLFAMLSIAVPVMNLGLVRMVILNFAPVEIHFLEHGVDTYRRAYQELNPDWFPVVPTVEGLAYQKSEQVFTLLQNADLERRRRQAFNDALIRLRSEAKRLSRGDDVRAEAGEVIRLGMDSMGTVEMERFRQTVNREERLSTVIETLGLKAEMEARYTTLRERSTAAMEALKPKVPELDEKVLYFVPSLQEEQLDRASMGRLEQYRERMGEAQMQPVLQQARDLEGERLRIVREQVQQLGGRDLAELKQLRTEDYLEELQEMEPEELAMERADFVYRLRTQERNDLVARTGDASVPDHDFAALFDSVFRSSSDQQLLEEQGPLENIREVWRRISWHIWMSPILHWSAFVTVVFLFMVCLAEWLRRKWVERENLAFPLVEVADHLIRHDFRMEVAEDVVNPPRRAGVFSPVFWAGFGLGALILFVEAYGYYKTGSGFVIASDLSGGLLAEGPLKELNNVIFILSPILLGLFFLVNLEVSFSVWSLYFILRLSFFSIGKAVQGGISDPNYVGWASRSFPFEMEQMLGAGLLFGVLLLIKAFKGRKSAKSELEHAENRYVPGLLMCAGLFGLPLVMALLVFDMGMAHMGVFVLFFIVWVFLGITSARIRSETGLPMQWVNYDMNRLPLMLGLSQSLGVKSFLSYTSLAFLPVSLLFRLLPQQLENLELARRHRLRGSLLAAATLIAFLTALGVGLISLLTLAHWLGDSALGAGATSQGPNSFGLQSYGMWVQHFLGEKGLMSFTSLHATRLLFVVVGASILGVLILLRSRFLNFPFHPMGYLLFVFSIFHLWLSPYYKGGDVNLSGASWLWGSAFIAWLIKKLMIKYGGMNTYRAAKPAFIGLIVGSLAMLFFINVVDLAVSARADRPGHSPSDFEKLFIEKPSFTPTVY